MAEMSILSYEGPLTFSTIDRLLTQFKYKAQENNISFNTYKKLISVMIEALENIYKYSDRFNKNPDISRKYAPTFRLVANQQYIRLETTNPVHNSDIEVLSTKIDRVNNKTREELKALYRETITNGHFSPKGGAGLGFIEMAKTSGHNLEYSFKKISDEFSVYSFCVTFSL
ncbi:MAG: SiaB family protein kinase [Bacteroidota bacterium]